MTLATHFPILNVDQHVRSRHNVEALVHQIHQLRVHLIAVLTLEARSLVVDLTLDWSERCGLESCNLLALTYLLDLLSQVGILESTVIEGVLTSLLLGSFGVFQFKS